MGAAAMNSNDPRRARIDPALVAIFAGVCAALHIGKLPPAITALQAALGSSLVEAGFLLSMVQLAGMSSGLAFGALADSLGQRRSMLVGLTLLAVASALGAAAANAATLMALRAVEGFGFLLVVLAAPALVRRLVAPGRVSLMLGLWGAYMPLAIALALLVGPWVIAFAGWRAWWLLLALLTAAMALWLRAAVPAGAGVQAASASAALPWSSRLRETLAAPGPWLVAMAFAMYSGQWLAVIGFLPTIYAQAGVAATLAGGLTALAAAVNIVGNVAAGRLLHGGARPVHLLAGGYVVMGLAAAIAFGDFAGTQDASAQAPWRYLAVLLFSMSGGLVPATLFTLAMRVAPSEASLSTTVGWVQQWSAFGQFAGPPLVAWVAVRAGGWQYTWIATGACTLAGLALTAALARPQMSRINCRNSSTSSKLR